MPASEIIYVLVVLLGIAMCRNLPVPFTVILVLIGMLLGNLSHSFHFMESLQGFSLSPEIMLFIFLPALIFESGFALDARQMLKDLPPILILAIPAMLMSTFVVGLGIWWALDIKLIVALVFGALISATDPVNRGFLDTAGYRRGRWWYRLVRCRQYISGIFEGIHRRCPVRGFPGFRRL
jgi:CPA1 family monovalent cation:H+ antiporter